MLMAGLIFFAVVGVIVVLDIAAIAIASKVKENNYETLDRPYLIEIHEEEKK